MNCRHSGAITSTGMVFFREATRVIVIFIPFIISLAQIRNCRSDEAAVASKVSSTRCRGGHLNFTTKTVVAPLLIIYKKGGLIEPTVTGIMALCINCR